MSGHLMDIISLKKEKNVHEKGSHGQNLNIKRPNCPL